jgi:hypothetical protein
MRGFLRAATCGLLGTVLIAGEVSRAAEDDDPSFDKKIINNFLSTLGLRSGNDIEYRERAPLVLPPRIDLPAPQANATAGTPNWPVDPDVRRRKEESNRRRDEVEESRPLRPNELNVGERRQGRSPTLADHPDSSPVAPAESGSRSSIFLAQCALCREDELVDLAGPDVLRFRHYAKVRPAGADGRAFSGYTAMADRRPNDH